MIVAMESETQDSLRISDLDAGLRPRERLVEHGAGSLSNAELLAILIRVGIPGCNAVELSQRLLHKYNSLEALARAPANELAKEKGIGLAKAITMCAAFALAGRLARETAMQAKVDTPAAVYNLLGDEMRVIDKEELRVLVVNTRYHLLQMVTVSKGSVNESIAHPRDILQPVISRSGYAFILAHNHPSGDPSPSQADLRLTRRINEAAELMQLSLLDHVIIGSPAAGRQPYYSFKEAGHL